MITPFALAEVALDLSKASFDNVYLSMTTLQGLLEDRVSALAHGVCPASSPIPNVVDECVGLLRRTRRDVKDTVDRCVLLIGEPLRGDVHSAVRTAGAPRLRVAR